MAISKDALIALINNLIKANGNQEITGPILNGVLREMTNGLDSPYFLYPKHATLSNNDIGKVVMNDGSGTAKVYAYTPATGIQKGKWKLTIDDINNLYDNSQIEINNNQTGITFNREAWRRGTIPSTPLEELNLISSYIRNEKQLNVSTRILPSQTEMEIEENTYMNTNVYVYNFPYDALSLLTPSTPALPAAPTYFPLGKLLGIDGNNAMISSNGVETYTLAEPLELDGNFFSSTGNIDISNQEDLMKNMMKFIIIPATNGHVRAITMNDLQPDGGKIQLKFAARQQFLGLAIGVTGSTVRVYDLKPFSFIISTLLNLIRKDVIDLDNIFNNKNRVLDADIVKEAPVAK